MYICIDHYNLSIVNASNRDEGTFQCQVQRTMDAHEARSARIQLILMSKNHAAIIFLFY